jgi:threonine/homoserine/homoserine lactone efflux protein
VDNLIAFAVSAAALLIVPGPTNSLIAASGGTSGLRRTILLLPAELCGYIIAIICWGLGLAAMARIVPATVIIAKLAASAILIASARKLWVFGSQDREHRQIGLLDVFLVTMSNPKALIFALSVVPHLQDGNVISALPYLASLSVLILAIGAGWSALGAGLGHAFKASVSIATFARAGAVILFGFALGLVSTALKATVF